ncbi:hypothetical protein CHLRE_02g101550v5 [Chlamydomonas reinhardtii]|uniref:BTB domain-containing protein n=1 Tax=Chlamydomonas reinhardtii TaxID=3055 RepID=A0A2K3E2A9_CHLRE|nr:uncharacterized protein CHLRE_02g101550v5 [Chlamydomonas reinhardtii]PNW86924.1 hypothetical protein CHLRE_02g101550v5 [Chlamydomonas reinhardtii]
MHLLKCSVGVFEGGYPRGTTTRFHGGLPETLVALSSGELRDLPGATARSGVGLRLGGLQLFTSSCGPLGAGGEDGDEPYVGSRMIRDPTWCAWSQQVYLMDGQAVLSLNGTVLSLVAGCLRGGALDDDEAEAADGVGATARFSCARFVTSDHAGCLYLADCARLCRVTLPRSWRAADAPLGSARAADLGTQRPPAGVQRRLGEAAAQGVEEQGNGQEEEEEEAVVTTLLVADSDITGLAFVPSGDARSAAGTGEGRGCPSDAAERVGGPYLLYSTDTAIYRLQIPEPPADDEGSKANATAAAPLMPLPELLAGRSDQEGSADAADGAAARFSRISGICVDAAGMAYVTDHKDDGETTALRRVSPGGAVATVAGGAELEGQLSWPSILPGSGYLCLCSFSQRALVLLDLGLTPPACMTGPGLKSGAGGGTGAAGGGGPGRGGTGWEREDVGLRPFVGADGGPPRSLASDLGSLLDSPPDATSDLTLRVGGRHFAVHRAILAARCDYFRQRLAADTFADGAAAELELPDADADAFALLLRWLYTGSAPLPTEPAAMHALAELADRLLLPELCHEVQVHILATLSPETVVEHLAWAEHLAGGGAPPTPDGPKDEPPPADLAAAAAGTGDTDEDERQAGSHGPNSIHAGRPQPPQLRHPNLQPQSIDATPFSQLLARLRSWYVARHLQIMEAAPDAVRRLMAAAPDLAFQLHLAAARRAAAASAAAAVAAAGIGAASRGAAGTRTT